MKVFCLRSVFQTNGVDLEGEVELRLKTGSVRFCRSVCLPVFAVKLVGQRPDGKKELRGECEKRRFRGYPYLLEIQVREKVKVDSNPWEMRKRLSARTEEIAALLHWSSPGLVGQFIADALFTREEDAGKNGWDWNDVEPFRIPAYHDDATRLHNPLQQKEQALLALPEKLRSAVSRAMRWVYRAEVLRPQIDKFIALWVAIETVAWQMSGQGGVEAHVLKLLDHLYPDETEMPSVRRKALKGILCKGRYRAVHGGLRDLPNVEALIGAASTVAEGAIRYLLEGREPQAPPEAALLKQLGI